MKDEVLMTVEQANVVSSLQSMRDRMMRELPKKYGDGFDGDMDTLLEALNRIKKQAQALATLRAELEELREKNSVLNAELDVLRTERRKWAAEEMRGGGG